MSLNDDIADAAKVRAIYLARFEAGERRKVLAILKQIERDIAGQLAADGIGGDLTAFRRARLEAILAQVRATIATGYKRVADTLAPEIRNLGKIEAAFAVKSINKPVGFALATETVTPADLSALASDILIRGAPSSEWWAAQSDLLSRKFAQEVRLGLAAGESNGQIIQRIRGTAANGFKDGIMQASRREAEALVRTSVQTVANEARMSIYKGNDDIIEALEFVATLDDRTTQQCAALDGLRWTLDGEPIGHDIAMQTPPLHWNCRSVLVPITKTWQEMGIAAGELSPGQRASMDGAKPDNTTYETWLKNKPDAFQDKVLGPGKAELWRSGKIGFRDLVDQSGRPLTLAELEAMT